jgi:protease-4
MPWSAGAAGEIISGVHIIGRYFSDKAFTLGLTVDIGRTGAAGQLRYDSQSNYASATHMVRAGQFMPNYFTDRFRHNTKYTSMELRGEIGYRERPLAGFFRRDSPRLYKILQMIAKSAEDPRVEVITLNFSGMEVLPEHAWEIRRELEEAQNAGKKILIFMDNGGMETYHLASVADRLVMDPMGTLLLPGYLSNRTYFSGSLEKLGIGFEAWRYFEYKSAVEAFSRDDMSAAEERQLQAYVDDQYELVRADVAASRPISPSGFDDIINNQTILRAEEALAEGLADTLARWNDLDNIVESMVGAEKSKLQTELLLQDARITRSWEAPAKIALVYGLGTTAMDRGIKARALQEKIRNLSEDEDIRAIVFRVDSPGGDPLASDLVAEVLREASEEKPVIVSQGQVAASGGYWISMDADTIVAGPNTVTGSIGVIGGWVYDNEFSERIGMSSDHVQRGDHADLMAGVTLPLLGLRLPHRNLTDAEQSRVQDHILSLYDTFVEKVSRGRDTTEAHIRAVGEGRIYSGIDGREAGLVDIIGGISTAIERARTAAGIPDDRQMEIVEVGERAGLFVELPFMGDSSEPLRSQDPVRDYIQLFVEHQPNPLIIVQPGFYPWYDPSAEE